MEYETDAPFLGSEFVHPFSMKQNLPRIRLLQSGQHPQNRRFAAAAGPQQTDQLPLLDPEADILYGMKSAEMFIQISYFNMHAKPHPFQIPQATRAVKPFPEKT